MRYLLALLVLVPQETWTAERKDLAIPMRDGAKLAADLYLPSKAGKYPVILIQTPYDKKHMDSPFAGVDPSSEVGRGSTSDLVTMRDREHYVYCVVDWRGFYASKPAMAGVDRKTWRRGQDGYDCVEWLAAQEFCDGKIGTWGGSALGKQQLDTAAEHPPHLVCAAPLIAGMGSPYDNFYTDGVFLEGHVKMLGKLGYDINEIVYKAHEATDPVWKFADRMTYRPAEIQVPCLMISGWWDNYPDHVIRTFEDIVAKGGGKAREHSKLLMGPWDHVSVGIAKQGDVAFDGAAKASAVAAQAYFERWLRGVDNGWDKTPRVRYWQVNEEKFLDAEAWTKIPREEKSIPIGVDGTYVNDPKKPVTTLGGANLPPMKHGPTDHAALGSRKDVLAFTLPPQAGPLRINGSPEWTFTYGINRDSADFMARLCEVREDGKVIHIADTARRVGAKAGAVTLRFPPVAYTIPKGRSLGVYLSSTNFPRYERNPHTGAPHWDEKTALDLEVTFKGEGSVLKLPLLKN